MSWVLLMTQSKRQRNLNMPMTKGSSKKVIAKNIKAEMHAGKPQKQAVAMSMRMAGKRKPAHTVMHSSMMKGK